MPPEAGQRRLSRWGSAVAGYAERHAQTCVASLGRLLREPLSALMTIGVISLALAIPGCLYLLVQNARQVGDAYAGALDVTVYLKPGETEAHAHSLAAQVSRRVDVKTARLVTATEGLAEFRRWSGFGPALDALKDNPLPHAIVVRPRVPTAEAVLALKSELATLPGVDAVGVDAAWVRRFVALLEVLKRTVLIVALMLGAAVLVVVGNTIRLDIDVRRPEIEVTKLVGGSDSFVRRPFLYGGLWYGLGGGLLAWLVVSLFSVGLSGPINRVAAAYDSGFRLHGLDWPAVAGLVLGGAVLGWLGAYLAATRHLRGIEPAGER